MYEFSPEPNSIFVCHTRWRLGMHAVECQPTNQPKKLQRKFIIFFQWKWNIIADKSAWHHHSTSLHVGQTARQLAGNQLKLLASKHSSLRSSLFFATKSTWLTVKVLFSFISFVAVFLLLSFRLFWCNCILLWSMILGFFRVPRKYLSRDENWPHVLLTNTINQCGREFRGGEDFFGYLWTLEFQK